LAPSAQHVLDTFAYLASSRFPVDAETITLVKVVSGLVHEHPG
jgi:hypothetical protein